MTPPDERGRRRVALIVIAVGLSIATFGAVWGATRSGEPARSARAQSSPEPSEPEVAERSPEPVKETPAEKEAKPGPTPTPKPEPKPKKEPKPKPPPPPDPLAPYQGLGTWLDIYDEAEWKVPEVVVENMFANGVQTLYLQTGNWRLKEPMFKPDKIARFVEAAHFAGIDVVAWYVPNLKELGRDQKRIEDALRFTTPNGETFDGFALDIESTEVRDIPLRNQRVFDLTRRFAPSVPEKMALGAIVPDPIGSLYWPDFPFAEVSSQYDVMLPMGYFTYRTQGRRGVANHVRAGIDFLTNSGVADPIHYIGGLAGEASAPEVRAYAGVVLRERLIGGGLYDYVETPPAHWQMLSPLTELRP